jgi:hypothetical protein
LNSYYQKKVSSDELDERHFIHPDVRNLTPFKMSPYARETSIYDKEPGSLGLGQVSEGPMRSKHPGILE